MHGSGTKAIPWDINLPAKFNGAHLTQTPPLDIPNGGVLGENQKSLRD